MPVLVEITGEELTGGPTSLHIQKLVFTVTTPGERSFFAGGARSELGRIISSLLREVTSSGMEGTYFQIMYPDAGPEVLLSMEILSGDSELSRSAASIVMATVEWQLCPAYQSLQRLHTLLEDDPLDVGTVKRLAAPILRFLPKQTWKAASFESLRSDEPPPEFAIIWLATLDYLERLKQGARQIEIAA